MRVIAEVTFTPIGTATPSVSRYVAFAIDELRNHPAVRYQLGSMSTVIEGERADVLAAVEAMNEAIFGAGCERVGTALRIDERRDKPTSADHKVAAVLDLIAEEHPAGV